MTNKLAVQLKSYKLRIGKCTRHAMQMVYL